MNRRNTTKNALKQFYVEVLGLFHHSNELRPFVLILISGGAICLISLLGFLEVTETLHRDELWAFDQNMSSYIQSFRNETFTTLVVFVTDMGNTIGYVIITPIIVLVIYWRRRIWRPGIETTIILLTTIALNIILKNYFNRPRPDIDTFLVDKALSTSFPSGHTMCSIAFYGFLAYLVWVYGRHLITKLLATVVCILIFLSISLSRVYLGVHYPSDILAGLASGLFWLTFCILAFRSAEFIKGRKKEDAIPLEES